MKFLRRLCAVFSRSPAPPERSIPGLSGSTLAPTYVRGGSDVARFVFEARDLMADGKPKSRAFKPDLHPDLRRFEVSICGLFGVSDERMWYLGRTIRLKEGKRAIASLNLATDHVAEVGLQCEPAPDPPDFEEHGVVVGWPSDPDAKSSRLDLQAELAARVHQTFRPDQK